MNDRIEYDANKIASALDSQKRLDSYYKLLLEENSRVNLVSRETDLGELEQLAAESLLPMTAVDRAFSSYLDIGSGGGFPAIPIMLSGKITGPTLLMERIGKKSEALKRLLAALDLKAEVLAENFPFGPVDRKFDLITLRWVKLDLSLLKKIMSSLSPKGLFIHYSSEPISDSNYQVRTTLFDDAKAGIVKGFTIYQQV